uniref:Uncharacterized protein n=1 Tax=Cacopsylla melanoneura TaxID=428564 RepID=A0A8D8QM34_9HEMI
MAIRLNSPVYISLVVMLFPLSNQEPKNISWNIADLSDYKDRGISNFANRDLCNESGSNDGCIKEFRERAQKNLIGTEAIRAACDPDETMKGKIVCWLRRKYKKRTGYEVQYWNDEQGQHYRFAAHPENLPDLN